MYASDRKIRRVWSLNIAGGNPKERRKANPCRNQMNANIVIINGKVIQSIRSVRHYFTAVIKCGDEEICVHIPKRLFRLFSDPVKKALAHTDEYVYIKGFIDNGDQSIKLRIIADEVHRGRWHDYVNIVVVAGVVCEVQKRVVCDNISLGILEGRRMVVISGNIPKECQELHVFDTVKLIGRIEGQQVVFDGIKEVENYGFREF